MRKLQFYFFALALIVLSSCQRDFNVELSFDEELTVLNGILVADSSPVEIRLFHLKPLNDTLTNAYIPDAVVSLFEDNEFLGNLQHTDSGKYVMELAPQSGKTYRVDVVQENREKVWAEAKVPHPVPIVSLSLDSIPFSSQRYNPVFKLKLKDYENESNYYWISIEEEDEQGGQKIFSPKTIYTTSPYIDDFRRGIDPYEKPPYNIEYSSTARFSDVQFAGDTCSIDFYSRSGGDYKIQILNAEHQYDKYFKSMLKYYDYRGMVEDLPIYYQPSFIYSNVNNGTGILGAMSIDVRPVFFFGGINTVEKW